MGLLLTDTLLENLTKIELFSHKTVEGLRDDLNGVKFRILKFPAGRLVASRGDDLNELLVLVGGSLSADFLDNDGRQLKVETLEAPTLVAATILFADAPSFPVQLTAMEDAQILAIPKEALFLLMSRDVQLLKKILADSGNRVKFLADKIRYFQFHTIESKLAVFLLEEVKRHQSTEIELRYSINTLAELFGVSRPSLSRVLGRLREERILDKSRRRIHILRPEALQEILDMQ